MVELCNECGFDARELTGSPEEQQRLATAYTDLERLLDHPDADRRPAAETWSAREYVDHCLEAAAVILGWVADLTDDGEHWQVSDSHSWSAHRCGAVPESHRVPSCDDDSG